MDITRSKTYKGSDISSVAVLEGACRFDESNFVRLISMTARRDEDNSRVTFLTYEDDNNVTGELVLKEYQDNFDLLKVMEAQAAINHLFDGTAYIGDRIVKLAVFRA